MSTESDTAAAFGLSGSVGWLVGGGLGGALGAAAFGLLIWLLEPGFVEAAVPAIYGLEGGPIGWAIHVVHGVVFGLAFGFLVTRDSILGVLRANAETEAVSAAGAGLRIVAAGVVFGLAVFAILPLLVLPVWAAAIGAGSAAQFPMAAGVSLLGHVLFGTVLGVVFAAAVDLRSLSSDRRVEG